MNLVGCTIDTYEFTMIIGKLIYCISFYSYLVTMLLQFKVNVATFKFSYEYVFMNMTWQDAYATVAKLSGSCKVAKIDCYHAAILYNHTSVSAVTDLLYQVDNIV